MLVDRPAGAALHVAGERGRASGMASAVFHSGWASEPRLVSVGVKHMPRITPIRGFRMDRLRPLVREERSGRLHAPQTAKFKSIVRKAGKKKTSGGRSEVSAAFGRTLPHEL